MVIDDPTRVGHARATAVRFEDLWEHREFVRDYCLSIVGDFATAEDLAQETFVRAFSHLDAIDANQPLRNWLAAVARRCSIDELRRRRRHALPTERLPEAPNRDPDPAEMVRIADDAERVVSAMNRLNDRERHLLVEQLTNGTSLEQIARADGSTVNGVRSALSRARRKLDDVLGDGSVPALVPVFAFARWARRKVAGAGARVNQMVPGIPGGFERLGDAVSAGVVAAAVAAGGLVGTVGPAATGNPEPAPGPRSVEPSLLTTEPRALRSLSPVTPEVPGPPTPAPVPEPSPPVPEAADQSEEAATDDLPAPDPEPGIPEETPVSNPASPDQDQYQQPEDAQYVTGLYAPPASGEDASSNQHAFITASAEHWTEEPVDLLFATSDSGVSWERREAWGWQGGQLVVGPDYPEDDRVFSIGSIGGLQVSFDGGHSFVPVPGGAALWGGVDLAPGFGRGDDRILIGGPEAWMFDAATNVVTPLPAVPVSPTNPVDLAFDRTDPTGEYFYAAVTRQSAEEVVDYAAGEAGLDEEEAGVYSHVVYRCTVVECTEVWENSDDAFEGAMATDSGALYLFPVNAGLYSSRDGVEFEDVPGFEDWHVQALTAGPAGGLYAGVMDWSGPGGEYGGGIMRSTDGGDTWDLVAGDVLNGGGEVVALDDGNVLATSYDRSGPWCSADGGETWAPRCPVP